MHNNKRTSRRYDLELPLKYYVRGNQSFSSTVASDNISAGGIGFTGRCFIPPSTNLMLELMVAKKSISSIGKVAWVNVSSRSNKYKLGVEFLEMNPMDREYLKKYLSGCGAPEAQQ
ncbi:MAG: PilZ domain-containing protein [Candidatus Omnitrophota bacterium]|jgi:c-di-GMP-binding flagellar brake protein YcgR